MHFSMLNVIVFICFVCATKDLYWLCPSMVRVTFLYDAAIRCRLACRLLGLCPLTPLMHAERSLTLRTADQTRLVLLFQVLSNPPGLECVCNPQLRRLEHFRSVLSLWGPKPSTVFNLGTPVNIGSLKCSFR